MIMLRTPNRERGVVLLISLIMLVVLTLGALSLFRQVGTGIMIASNLTFKNAALIASDRGVESARTWLVATANSLDNGSVANGYFSAWCNTTLDSNNNPNMAGTGIDDCKTNPVPSQFDPLTYNWANSVLVTNDDGNGNSIRYVIHRLCRIPGSLNFTNVYGIPQECVTLGTATASGSKSEVGYGAENLANTIQPYFRVTVQTTGPKNTVVYSQATVY